MELTNKNRDMHYYIELKCFEELKHEINKFATNLELKKGSCYHHRVEMLISNLLTNSNNQIPIKNKLIDFIKSSNYEADIESYLLQFIQQSLFEDKNFELRVPESLIRTIEENKVYDLGMVEGYLNFEKSHQEIETNSTKPEKELPDFFCNLSNTQEFLLDFNKTFPWVGGKNLAGLIYLMEKESILKLLDRELTSFGKSFINHFGYQKSTKSFVEPIRRNRNIDFEKIEDGRVNSNKQFIEPLKEKLIPIIRKHKNVG